MSEEFVSYQDALSQLGLGEDELNQLVASGELRAFHEGDDVNFKAEDIAGLRRSRETEPTIVLSDTQAEELSPPADENVIDLDSLSTDETVLNIEGLLEDEAEGTTPIPGSDLLEGGLLEGEDDIDLESIGDDTVLDTDELDLEGDFSFADEDTMLTGEEETIISGGVRTVQMVKKQSHAGMTVALAATLVIALIPAAFMLSLMSADGGSFPIDTESFLLSLNPLVESILGLF